MWKYIDKIRKLPLAERKSLAFMTATVVTLVVLISYVFTTLTSFFSSPSSEEVIGEELIDKASPFDTLKSQVNKIKEDVSSINSQNTKEDSVSTNTENILETDNSSSSVINLPNALEKDDQSNEDELEGEIFENFDNNNTTTLSGSTTATSSDLLVE